MPEGGQRKGGEEEKETERRDNDRGRAGMLRVFVMLHTTIILYDISLAKIATWWMKAEGLHRGFTFFSILG